MEGEYFNEYQVSSMFHINKQHSVLCLKLVRICKWGVEGYVVDTLMSSTPSIEGGMSMWSDLILLDIDFLTINWKSQYE